MKVTLLQLDIDLGEPVGRRRERVAELAGRQNDADLVVLPEIWATGYFAFDAYAATAEPVDGPTTAALSEAARRAGVHLHGGSIVERSEDGALYNTSLLFGPDGSLLHTQRKFHVFGYRSREAEMLRNGERLRTVGTLLGGIGMTTCYDLRFPELFRVLVDDGAEMFIVPAAWPAARLEHWRLFTRVRAVENQCYVLACNTAGTQAGTSLGGHSAVIDPWGEVLAEAGAQEEVLSAEVDLGRVHEVREEFPVLKDRRLSVDSKGVM